MAQKYINVFFEIRFRVLTINNKNKMEKVQEIRDTARLPRPRRGESWMAVQPQTGIATPQGHSKPAK